MRNNTIDGNPRQGVLIGGNAVVSLSGNIVTNNGLSPGSEPAGGVVVRESGQADLGGGTLTISGQAVTSPGGNRLQGNGVADVRNMRTGYTVKAEGNCWDHATVAEVIADVAGTVDADPLGTVCGSSTGTVASAADRRAFRFADRSDHGLTGSGFRATRQAGLKARPSFSSDL